MGTRALTKRFHNITPSVLVPWKGIVLIAQLSSPSQLTIFRNFYANMTSTSSFSTDVGRMAICQDTMRRTQSICADMPDVTHDSTFIHLSDLPPFRSLDGYCPNFPQELVEIIPGDSLTVARQLMSDYPAANGRIAVLNMASCEVRGGGWNLHPAKTQECALCYSSSLFETLKPEYYGWPNLGPGSAAGIFSPTVLIFKYGQQNQFRDLPVELRKVVSVISVAAPHFRDPHLAFSETSHYTNLRDKIRLIYKMAVCNKKTFLVLGAMGCGTYNCPPLLVAREMKSILEEEEFRGWFQKVVFAIRGESQNFMPFQEVFRGRK